MSKQLTEASKFLSYVMHHRFDAIGVNTPPPKGGGFGLRLKAGLVGHAADVRPTHSSSSSADGVQSLTHPFHISPWLQRLEVLDS